MSDERPSDRPVTRPGDPVESRHVANRQRNIRVEDALWDECAAEAARLGMNISEFVREAMMFRLGVLAQRDGRDLREIEALVRRATAGGEG